MTEWPAPELVLFDLDDTLYDHLYSRDCALEAVRRAVPALCQVPLARIVRDYDELLERGYGDVLAGRSTIEESREQRYRDLLEIYGVTLSPSERERLVALHARVYEASQRAIPGSGAVVAAVRQLAHVGVITNGLTAVQHRKLRVCGFDDLVVSTVTSEDVGAAKPDPLMIRVAAERAGRALDRTVVVGDSLASDVAAARSAGVRAVWLNRRHQDTPPDAVCGPLREIRALEPTEAVLGAIGFGNVLPAPTALSGPLR